MGIEQSTQASLTGSAVAPEFERVRAGSWYALAVFTLMYLANNIDRSIMSIVIEPVRREFELTDGQLGALTGFAFAITYSLAGLPIGYLIDRVNRRNLLAVLMTVWSVCTGLCGLAQSYWNLVWARLAVGASEAGGAPAALSMIGDLFPKRRRSLALSIFWSSTAFGTATSFVFGSIVAVEYGWRAAFLIAGLPGLVLVVLILATIREPVRGAMDGAEALDAQTPSLLETWRYVTSYAYLVHAFIGIGLSAVMLSGALVWAVSFFVRMFSMELAHAGMIVGVSVAGFGAVGSLMGGFLGDHVYKRWGLARLPLLTAMTTIVAAVSIAIMSMGSTVAVALGAFMVFELLSRAYTAPGYNFLLTNVPPRMRGVVMSVLQGTTNLVGYGLGPVLVGVVSDASGSLRYGVMTLAGIGVWVSLHFYWAYRAALRGGISPRAQTTSALAKDVVVPRQEADSG